jgi:hypothetical protein
MDVEPPKCFADWRSAYFAGSNPPFTGPLDDPDGDSVVNLMQYALHRNPAGPDPEPPARQSTQRIGNQDFLALSYDRLKSTFDLDDIVEVSLDLATWQSGPLFTTGVSIVDHGDTETITIRDTTPMSPATPRFIRLKVRTTN